MLDLGVIFDADFAGEVFASLLSTRYVPEVLLDDSVSLFVLDFAVFGLD